MTQFLALGEAKLEYIDLPATKPGRPELLMLHEGVGSVSMWRDFPATLAAATGCRCIAYSREGFGRSSPRSRPYTPVFMHEEAFDVLPQLREALAIERPVLVGHSTGASMALIHAGADRWPVAAVVAMAPLTYVEESNLASIRAAREMYQTTRWREKLARHHDDVDAAFFGWNDIWLAAEFRSWSIAADIAGIRSPILVVLGEGDPYSTPAQVKVIEENAVRSERFELLVLPDCGHEPHRDQPAQVVAAVVRLLDAV